MEKMSQLTSCNFAKYEDLTGEEVLKPQGSSIIKQTRFT